MSMVDNLLLEARALDVAESGHFADTYDGVVDSPCVNVCRMTPDRSHCEGQALSARVSVSVAFFSSSGAS